MTDNDIIKALEIHADTEADCSGCPIYHSDTGETCVYELSQNALDLINRQKAEIEKWCSGYMTQKQEIANLEAELKTLQKAIQVQEIMLDNEDYRIDRARAEGRAEGRAEAITEVAERVKAESEYGTINISPLRVDQIAKEMKGEQ